MLHIILIEAYTNLEFLLEQLDLYDEDPDFKVYIHWDKKTFSQDILQAISTHKSVQKVCSLYSINWGGHNLLSSMIALCRYALSDLERKGNPECFIHSISGTDILFRSLDEFKFFFNQYKNIGFMEYFQLPNPNWQDGGLKRITLKHPLDRLNIRDANQALIYNKYLKEQERKGVYRPLPSGAIYGGGCWWSITREMAIYWIQHYNDDNLFERLKDTFGPEEIHPQTILLRSPYSGYIRNTSLHYICWNYGTRGAPALLENFDLPYMIRSSNIWARKIAVGISDGVKSFYKWFSTLPPFRSHENLNDNQELQEIAEYLLRYSGGCPLLGVMDGLMGSVIYLLCYGKICNQEECIQTATEMLDDAVSRWKEIATADFNNGIIGFAYSIAWLYSHGFVIKKAIYEQLLSSFDKNVVEAIENEQKRLHLQAPFWSEYYCILPYIKIRNLYNTDSFSQTATDATKKLLQQIKSKHFKQSLGMAGVAGLGFSKLHSLYINEIPPFLD